jgi:hypothetical protein
MVILLILRFLPNGSFRFDCIVDSLIFFLSNFGRLLPQEAGGRSGCLGLRYATVLYRAGTGAVKELNPRIPGAGFSHV